MGEREIEIGDTVSVYFEQLEPILHAKVMAKPQDTGDCWKLWRAAVDGFDHNHVWNVQNYAFMQLEP